MLVGVQGEKIIKRAPSVDIVFGPQTLHKLPDLYNEKERSDKNQIDISFPKLEKFLTTLGSLSILRTKHFYGVWLFLLFWIFFKNVMFIKF